MEDQLGKPRQFPLPGMQSPEDIKKAKEREEMFKKMSEKSIGEDQDTLSKRMGFDLFK